MINDLINQMVEAGVHLGPVSYTHLVPGSFQREMAAVRGGLHIQDADVGRVGKTHRLDGARGSFCLLYTSRCV